MTHFVTLSTEGLPLGFYSEEIHGSEIPADAVAITDEQWHDFIDHQGFRAWKDGAVVPYTRPAIPEPTRDVRTAKADIWRRASDAEADQILAGLDALPLRKRQIYNDATYLDHADPLFDELMAGFVQAFGSSRASVLLAPSA